MSFTPAARRWSTIIDEYEASGLSVRDFSRQRGINPSTLASWRSKLGRSSRSGRPKARFMELLVRAEEEEEEAVDARCPAPTERGLIIRLRRPDAALVVKADTDLALLRRVVDALC